jgi:hypothetical protein
MRSQRGRFRVSRRYYQPYMTVSPYRKQAGRRKYDLLLRDVFSLFLPFVVREGLLKDGEILRFSALTVSRLAHAQEDFQRHRGSLNWRALGPDAKAIVYRIWRV